MDKINFTGIRNISACLNVVPHSKGTLERANLLLELTNDVDGKDLEDFLNVLNRCQPDIGNCDNPQIGIINIMTSKLENRKDVPKLSINQNVLPVNTKTAAMFEYIAKLTKRILKLPDYKIANERDGNMKFAQDYLIPGIPLDKIASNAQEYMENMLMFCQPEHIKMTSERINGEIHKQMVDWLM